MSTGFPPGRSENTSGQRLAPEWSPRCELVSLGYGCWHTGSRCFFQVSVHKGDGHRPLARCGGDALDRAIAHVPYHTTLEEVVNLPGTGVVAMPEEANNDSHLGGRRSGSRQPCDPSSPRRNTSRSGGPPPPQRHAVVDQSSAKLDLHLLEAPQAGVDIPASPLERARQRRRVSRRL